LLAVLALVPLAAFELVSPLPAATQAFQRARVAAGRVFDVTDMPPAVREPHHPVEVGVGPHTVSLHSAWASYPGAPRAALRGVDLVLSPRRRVALVGPSGGGKSTLADVLVRFLPTDAGEASLDGIPMERLVGDDVRRVIGLVEQHPHLFDTTLAENLRVGRRTATDDELCGVLARVGLGVWLAGLPDGLATPVGPAGARLSGGQRQRVAVARALLADFPVLVLDEPTAHLEPAAADALTADVLQLIEGRSTLLITHRLAGLEQVDEVLVLAEGQVVERGTHAGLMAAGGRYAGLWWEERMHDRPQDRWPEDRRPGPGPDGPSHSYTEGSETP
jgi:ABC-type multidrug transport system fused ATPase/permease subunit